MKRLSLLFVFVLAVFTGCKKEASKVTKINDDLVGNWIIKSNKIIYYDRAGQKEYEEVLTGSQMTGGISFMKGLKGKVLSNYAQELNIDYQLVEKNKLVFIKFNNVTVFDAGRWKISEAASAEMTWKQILAISNMRIKKREKL